MDMDIETQLKECTTSFDDFLLELLADPEAAKYYLEISLEAYEKDNNIEMLAHSIRNVIVAQGGLTKFAERTNSNPKHLYDILNGKHFPQLNNMLDMLVGLGFRPRFCLEYVVTKDYIDAYTADMLFLEQEDSEPL